MTVPRGLRFVVTGTGRSGTGYASRLFTAAGVACGHEAVFGPRAGLHDPYRPPAATGTTRAVVGRVLRGMAEDRRRARLDLVGDASWMAVPRLAAFDGTVILLLRHPLPVVRSLAGMRFFSAPHGGFGDFARRYLRPSGDDLADAMRWWTLWTTWAETHAEEIVHLERFDAAVLQRLLDRIGVAGDAAAAVAAIPAGVNSSIGRGLAAPVELTWADLPSGRAKTALAATAERLGYDPTDPTVSPQN